jgi:hypothetical protein
MKILLIFVAFEVLTAAVMNVAFFCDTANFYSEDGGDKFLRSVGSHTVLFPDGDILYLLLLTFCNSQKIRTEFHYFRKANVCGF